MITRRTFLKNSALLGSVAALCWQQLPAGTSRIGNSSELISLSQSLLSTWCDALLKRQITDRTPDRFGGILCPAKNIIHGRVGDTLYPFLHLANKTGNVKYLDAALMLYEWMEQNVSQADGSWLNEPQKGSWKGTTVFSIIALGEALKHHGEILSSAFTDRLTSRLRLAGDYVHQNFSIQYGNINYPIAASYALSLLGEILDEQKFSEKGRFFAHESLRFLTKEGFIYGEGGFEPGVKGSYAIDLGYNVEESLPSLVMYGLLTRDEEVLSVATRSLNTHLEFMLPDGGWDNSWGTRNFKWTYWGSRTSDGCLPAFGLLAGRNPAFYGAALKNTRLLQESTRDGLLQGGPHPHGNPSVHHTFCHAKALTAYLDNVPATQVVQPSILPREKAYGVKAFDDIRTWLVAVGKFRATVTAYDKAYKQTTNGHPSGGALSLLWHEQAGLIFAASMNAYQRIEAGNMLEDKDPFSIPLTPRIEMKTAEDVYTNISDLQPEVQVKEDKKGITLTVTSALVNGNQQHPPTGKVNCKTEYTFGDKEVVLHFRHDYKGSEDLKIVFPVISKPSESMRFVNENTIKIKREGCTLKLSTDKKLNQLPSTSGRVYNHVPGLEAIPLFVSANELTIVVSCG